MLPVERALQEVRLRARLADLKRQLVELQQFTETTARDELVRLEKCRKYPNSALYAEQAQTVSHQLEQEVAQYVQVCQDVTNCEHELRTLAAR